MMNGSIKHRINFSHRRMKSSIEAFDRASTKKVLQKEQRPNQIFERAQEAYNIQNFMQTVELLEEHLEYRNNDNQALYLCGISYLHLNEPYEAINKLQRISNSSMRKEQSCLLLAMAYAKVQNSEKSLQVINQCLDKYNRFEEGYCYRGKLYLKFLQFQLAQKDFFYSLKLNSNSFISRVGLGDCYYQQHKYELAIKFYEESLQHIDGKFISSIGDINLKIGICYFELQMWNDAIKAFQKLRNPQLSSQSHYYLGVSYLKVNRKPQAILNLEYCIKLQANDSKILIQKAFKLLIQIYLTDFQFYDAVNILKLVDSLKIQLSCQYWKTFVEGCMLIIKSYYQDGLQKLNEVYDIIQKKKKTSSSPSNQKNQFENEFLIQSFKPPKQKSTHKIVYNSKGRKSFSLKHVRKSSYHQESRNKSLFKSIEDKPLVKLNLKGTETRIKTFFKSSTKKANTKPLVDKEIFTYDETIFVMPILLKFKAYGEFFINNYLRSLDTYQEYQGYMKNIFGKENLQLVYNRIICEAFLLNKTDLFKQSLQKMDLAIEEYRKYHNSVPVEPLLYKICTYLKLSLPAFFRTEESTQSGFGYDHLQHVLDVNAIYSQQLQNNHLSHYYMSIMYYLCHKYQDSQAELQKTLKIVEECSWKFLYLKGIVEIQLGNFYEAIKQFTAGLILDQSSDLYLGRAVSFLLEGTRRKAEEQKNKYNSRKKLGKSRNSNISSEQNTKTDDANYQIFVQNSFQDLQKFIQLQNDQDKISLWVSKLLFYNEAFQQASRALQKVDQKCQQLLEVEFWLKFYQGEFEECGEVGNLMIDAFQGKLLSNQEEEQLIVTDNNVEIIEILKYSKLQTSYAKWILILHLFKRQKYSLLTKLLQKEIFQTHSFPEEVELKYNLAVVYLIQGHKNKATSTFENLLTDVKGHEKLELKIKKVIEWSFDEDQCLPDLSEELGINGNHRVSEFLPYKPVEINQKNLKRIYLKLSIPFPQFPKPGITIKLDKQFLEIQLSMQVVQKRIQAPWIKMNKEKVQFTEEIMEAYTDFLKDTKDMVQITTQSLQEVENQSNLVTEINQSD